MEKPEQLSTSNGEPLLPLLGQLFFGRAPSTALFSGSSQFRQDAIRRCIAFTLVEMLVATAVAVVVVLLVFSFFGSIRDTSITATCTLRMKQLGAAFHAYSGEHNGCLPVQALDHTRYDSAPAWTYALYPYAGSYSLMFCPRSAKPGREYINGYMYNGYVSLHKNPSEWEAVPLTASKEPSKDAILIDGYATSAFNARTHSSAQPAFGKQTRTMGFYPHSTTTTGQGEPVKETAKRNVLYVDGHVETHTAAEKDDISTNHWRWPER